jgi:prepilin-type N-terminal cleavage/methylation domain-containing protein/prepilin-type processing-associated H-X9-DG protein
MENFPPQERPMKRLARKIPPVRGFTLIELLVVISIIGVLAALGFSGASAAIKKSQMTECLSNMRQIGTAMHLFVGENGGRLPSVDHKQQVSWTNTLGDFLGTNFIGRCPALKHYPERVGVTYGWNDMLTERSTWRGLPMSRISRPSATIVVAEKQAGAGTVDHFHFRGALGSRGRISLAKFEGEVNTKAHGNRANYLFVDGHVESLGPGEVGQRLATNNPHFLTP